MADHSKIQARTARDRIDLIKKWSDWFYEATGTWAPDAAGNLGMHLAYLFTAMAKGTLIEVQEHDEIIKCLRGQEGYDVAPVPKTEDIWEYIKFLDEEHDPVKKLEEVETELAELKGELEVECDVSKDRTWAQQYHCGMHGTWFRTEMKEPTLCPVGRFAYGLLKRDE